MASGGWQYRWRRCTLGLAAMVAMAMMWLIVLPRLSQQSRVRAHIDALHAADINASAMFYSELECKQWLERTSSTSNRHAATSFNPQPQARQPPPNSSTETRSVFSP